MTSFFNEIVHHVHDEIQTSLDEIKVCDFDEIKSVFISLRSKISSRSDFICEADLFRWKTVFSGGAGGISIASQSFLLDDRSLRSGARPRIISLKNSPPDYFFTQNALSGFESHLFMHKKRIPLQVSFFVAERVGFEPTSLRGHHDFELLESLFR